MCQQLFAKNAKSSVWVSSVWVYLSPSSARDAILLAGYACPDDIRHFAFAVTPCEDIHAECRVVAAIYINREDLVARLSPRLADTACPTE